MSNIYMSGNLGIDKSEIQAAVIILKNNPACTTLLTTLKKMLEDADNKDTHIQLMDIQSKVEVITWCNEDIADALAQEGFETSEKNIEVVCNCLKTSLHAISVELGWDVIYSTINNSKRLLTKFEKP